MSAAPRCFAVVAPPRWGKTRAVRSLTGRARAAGVSLTGVVQPAAVSGDRVVRYQVERLPDGDSRLLATRRATGRGYRFEPEAFAWSAAALERPGTLLVLDEVGLLEARGEGHAPALLKALSSSMRRAVLLAVRQEVFESLVVSADAAPKAPPQTPPLAALLRTATRWDLDPDRATRSAQLDSWAQSLMEATR